MTNNSQTTSKHIYEIDFRSRLVEISKMGFVKTMRKGDTGIGFTLETLLGIRENNIKVSDLTYQGLDIELKSQRRGSKAMVTIFTLEADIRNLNDVEVIKKYGYENGQGRYALKNTLSSQTYSSQGLKTVISSSEKRINIINHKETLIWSWDINRIKPKIGNLLFVIATKQGTGEDEHFHYDEATLSLGLDDDCFQKMIHDDLVKVDLRMHLKPSGISRNHGTGFRTRHLAELSKCYQSIEKII